MPFSVLCLHLKWDGKQRKANCLGKQCCNRMKEYISNTVTGFALKYEIISLIINSEVYNGKRI